MNNIDQAMQRNIDKYYLILILECDLNIDSKIYDVDRSSLSRERKNQLADTRLVFFFSVSACGIQGATQW